jgi:hypothetical protein
MAHWALVGKDNLVHSVIVAEEEAILGITPLAGYRYIQTSYNGRIRKNFASVGFYYDKKLDAFIPPRPDGDYILDKELGNWVLRTGSKTNKSNGIMRVP